MTPHRGSVCLEQSSGRHLFLSSGRRPPMAAGRPDFGEAQAAVLDREGMEKNFTTRGRSAGLEIKQNPQENYIRERFPD